MKPWVIFLAILISFSSCQKEAKTTDTFLQQLPSDASFYIEIDDMTHFLSEMKNSLIAKKGAVFNIVNHLNSQSAILSMVKTEQKSLIGFYRLGGDKYNFILITKSDPDFFDTEQVRNLSSETLNYENYSYNKYGIDGSEVFSTQKNGFQILSSSQLLLENILRSTTYKVESSLQRLYDASTENTSATAFINLNEFSTATNNAKSNHVLADWTSLDIVLNQNDAALNGVAIASDSTKNFINLFKGTTPLSNRTPLYAPSKTEAMISYTFNDFNRFQENQNRFLDRIKTTDTLFNTIEEVGIISLNKQKVVFLSSFGTEGLSAYLAQNRTSTTSYQGSDINGIQKSDLISSGFNPLVVGFKSNFYTILENTFVFSETVEPLQNVISNYRNKSTFSKSIFYTTAQDYFANESNIMFVADHTGLEALSSHAVLTNVFHKDDAKAYTDHTFAAQWVSDRDFMHTHFLVSENKKESRSQSTIPLFTLELDADLATDPLFIKNHRTGKQEIVVQDQDNFLYLISTDGKVLWKKQLNGKVQGKIQQVDIYKNGRLQLAFCTNNAFLILDRNGDIVNPFNIKFEGGNLNPLAIFDYEGNRDYRFVITQGKKVFMYNNKAKIVSGFTYKEAQSDIIAPPKHFRLSNKDYLLFQLADNSLKILHRAGGERIPIKQKIDFSNNDIFLYKNKFSMTDKNGILVQIDQQGKISKTNFNLGNDHGMFATSKTLALMDDNVLSIKGKKVDMDLGVYTKPQIFYINDKIYVAITDLQSQKVYLYDSQSKTIPNFPVFGNSAIDMTDMDNDKKLEIVAKDQENSLIVYKMN